jgi:hypothetical protein
MSSRIIPAGSIAYGQVDIYLPGPGFNRIVGLNASAASLTAFINNAQLTWTLMNGTSIPDSSVSAGFVYFNEILGSAGYYSVRFFPDRTGFWRIILKFSSIPAEIVLEYQVAPAGLFEPQAKGSLIASTTK